MIRETMEPFIILPYGDMQDIIFFIDESIENQYNFLKDMVYKGLSDEILLDNSIRVINRMHEIIFFHIYPTSYHEKCSNRIGQYLIVGFIINKKCLQKRFDNLICACSLFFEAIMRCGYIDEDNLSIPTKFLYKVNSKYYDTYIRNYLIESRKQVISAMESEHPFMLIIPNKRLDIVYNFIRKNVKLLGEYWILVDVKNSSYYYKRFKRVYNLIIRDKENE